MQHNNGAAGKEQPGKHINQNVDGEEEEQELNEEEIVQVIIQLGNEILRNLGVEEPIDDVAVFFSDEFYIQFFQAAFPEIDFSQLTAGQDVAEMAENIQALIDLLGEQILKYDLSHIKGEEIVNGNPEHCINLLQLVQEISMMIHPKGGAGSGPASPSQAPPGSSAHKHQLEDDADDVEDARGVQYNKSPMGEDGAPGPQAQQQFHLQGDDQDFDEEDFDPQHNPQLHYDEDGMEDDDELEKQFMQQLNHGGPAIQNPGHHLHGDSGEEPMDEDDLKMYEQFLAANSKQQQELIQKNPNLSNNIGGPSSIGGGLSGLEQQLAQMDEDDEDIDHHQHQEDDDGEEINLDDIDIEQLDPQILQIAEQMGVHPHEVLKQIMKMNQNGEMEEDDEHHMHDGEDDGYGEEIDDDMGNFQPPPGFEDPKAREDQLRREKELFKQQMGLAPTSDKKSAGSKGVVHQQQQQQMMQYQQEDDYGQDDEDDESYYSENEIKTRIKLINQKSYSAPYIIISDCYPEPLCDDEGEDDDGSQMPSKAYSTTVLQSLELQEQMMQQQHQQQEGGNTAGLLQQQQAKLMKHHHQADDDEEEEELDVDISKKLLELQQQQQQQKGSSSKPSQPRRQDQQQQQQQLQQHADDDEDEQDGEEDEEMMIDLDQLDDQNREMLLEYLKQEYDKNPAQFPFPKELIEDFMKKEQMNKLAKINNNGGENESVKDINSQEMILEDVGGGSTTEHHKIVGGGQQIEDDEEHELHEEDEEGAEYLGQQNMQVEYREKDGGIIDLKQHQHQMALLQQQQQMAMMQQAANLQGSKKKSKKSTKTGKRPKSAGRKKGQHQVQMNIVGQQVQQQVIPEEDDEEQTQQIQQIPEDQLQQIIQMLQEQQVDLDSLDPNLLQQIWFAQQQQQNGLPPQVLAAQSQPRSNRSRPQTAGRKASGSKKRSRPATGVIQQSSKVTRTLQPPKAAKLPNFFAVERITNSNKKRLIPATGGAATMNQGSKKKKRPMTAQTKQQRLFQQQMMQQHQHHFPHDLSPEEQQQLLLLQHQQQQQQQEQDEDVIQEEEVDDENQANMEEQQQIQEQDEAAQAQQLAYQLQEIPNFSEEYLQQLSEEQLELLLHQQQQLMLMQQQQRQLTAPVQKTASRPKSGKQSAPKSMRPQSAKVPTVQAPGFNAYIQKNQKKISHPAVQMPKKKKKSKKQVAGVLMNNYFPALEGGDVAAAAALFPNKLDPRYPKFGIENLAKQAQAQQQQQSNPNMVVQDQIDEVPQEQEEAESQENIQTTHGLPNFYQPPPALAAVSTSGNKSNQMNDGDDEDQDQADPEQQMQQDVGVNQDSPNGAHQPAGIDLTDEQLIELIQNAHALTPEQQQQLQLILQQRMKLELANERAQSYQNIYDILMDNVRRAKDRLAPLGQVSITHSHIGGGAHGIDSEETDRRILRQKQEFETLYRQYQLENKAKELKKKDEDAQVEKRLQRESRIQAIREKKFQEELLSHQKSLNYKRNAQQVLLCQKVYKLASELEKNKLLQEKREFKENQSKKKLQNKLMVDAIETYYKNQVQLLKERIESERFERRVAQQAQQQALNRMKKELADQKKKEVDRYLQLLKQEDSRYEFESSNVAKIENEIIKMYKKGK